MSADVGFCTRLRLSFVQPSAVLNDANARETPYHTLLPANSRKHMSLKANEGKKYINRLGGRSASPRQTKLGISKKKKRNRKKAQGAENEREAE
jgi:hypothetical protein